MSMTASERASLRRQVDATSDVLSDADMDAIWAEAEGLYPAHRQNRPLIFAVVRLQVWRELMVGASKRVDYKQNQSEEKMSQLLKNMEVIEARFKKLVDALVTNATAPAVQWGGIRQRPRRDHDREDDPYG